MNTVQSFAMIERMARRGRECVKRVKDRNGSLECGADEFE